jgi:hypothetical protein
MRAVFVAAALLLPGSVGVDIQAGPVCMPTTVQPGRSYALPAVEVANSGSGGESIQLWVQNPTPGTRSLAGRRAPSSWVSFSYPRKWGIFPQSSVGVAPGEAKWVPARLTVPASAKPGFYATWIVDGTAGSAPSASHSVTVNLAAEAITDLEFTVAKPGTATRHAVCITPGASHPKEAAGTRGAKREIGRGQRPAASAANAPGVAGGVPWRPVAVVVAAGAIVLWWRGRRPR